MITALILTSILHNQPLINPPVFAANGTLIARSYGRSGSSFRSFRSSAPSRIRIRNSTVRRVSPTSLKRSSDGRIPLTKTVTRSPKPIVSSTSYSRPRYQAPVIVQQDTTSSNPLFWMWLMNQNNNRPQVIQQAPQQPQTIVKSESNPLKDVIFVVLGFTIGGILVYYIFSRKNTNF